MNVQALAGVAQTQPTVTASAFSNGQLESGDFLTLMIQSLVNQDPLDPVKNEELLAQVSQIKNMETLAKLDQTLGKMTFEQQLATAGSLIGCSVKGISTAGENAEGVVVKVAASNAKGVTLVTDLGQEIPVDKVTQIEEVPFVW